MVDLRCDTSGRGNARIAGQFGASGGQPEVRKGDQRFEAYPDMSLARWHEQRGLVASPR